MSSSPLHPRLPSALVGLFLAWVISQEGTCQFLRCNSVHSKLSLGDRNQVALGNCGWPGCNSILHWSLEAHREWLRMAFPAHRPHQEAYEATLGVCRKEKMISRFRKFYGADDVSLLYYLLQELQWERERESAAIWFMSYRCSLWPWYCASFILEETIFFISASTSSLVIPASVCSVVSPQSYSTYKQSEARKEELEKEKRKQHIFQAIYCHPTHPPACTAQYSTLPWCRMGSSGSGTSSPPSCARSTRGLHCSMPHPCCLWLCAVPSSSCPPGSSSSFLLTLYCHCYHLVRVCG